MKPTGDEFQPRRDGWFEHEATWGEVVVGTVVADRQYRTKRWECVALGHGLQVEDGCTLWMRFREQSSGEEFSASPKPKHYRCVILTLDPADTRTGEPTEPDDTDAIILLIEKLGATHLATRDETTGEITCPDYNRRTHVDDGQPSPYLRGLIEHMRFAHELSVDDGIALETAISLHGQAHNPLWTNIGKGGFPHRHVPEERIDIDWVRNRKIRPIYSIVPRSETPA